MTRPVHNAHSLHDLHLCSSLLSKQQLLISTLIHVLLQEHRVGLSIYWLVQSTTIGHVQKWSLQVTNSSLRLPLSLRLHTPNCKRSPPSCVLYVTPQRLVAKQQVAVNCFTYNIYLPLKGKQGCFGPCTWVCACVCWTKYLVNHLRNFIKLVERNCWI